MATEPRFLDTVRRIASDVVAPVAAEVDRDARFPREGLDALKKARLLGALVPEDRGGLGLTLGEVASHCQALAQHCASTAMIYAMHQIQVGCLARHGLAVPFFRRYLEGLAERQNLIASVTSEVGTGGDLRTSIAAVEPDGPGFRLQKQATTISYGEHADDLLITTRRAPAAPGSDQVLVLVPRQAGTLERVGTWDTLGMRGTCSPAFRLTAQGSLDQVLPTPFAEIAGQTMVPFSHLLWASCWLGIATDAVGRARAFVRADARRKPGSVPPTASRLAEVSALLQVMRTGVHDVMQEYEGLMGAAGGGVESLSSLGFALRINNLKIATSQMAVQVANRALWICGMAGYKTDSPFSIGRHVRDAHSAVLMIGNDRIYATNASLLLVHKDE